MSGATRIAEASLTESPVRENRTPGSVRGASSNRRPYRDGRVCLQTCGLLLLSVP